MSIKKFHFTPDEKKLLIDAIEDNLLSYDDTEFYLKPKAQLLKCINSINSNFTTFTSYDRSVLIGCIRGFVLNENKDLYHYSEFELLEKREELKGRIEFLDIGLSLFNKIFVFKRQKSIFDETKKILFSERFAKLDSIINSKIAHYSIANDGHVYKVGIETSKQRGYSVDGFPFVNENYIELNYLDKSWYLKTTTPKEVSKLIEDYGKINKLSKGELNFIKLFN